MCNFRPPKPKKEAVRVSLNMYSKQIRQTAKDVEKLERKIQDICNQDMDKDTGLLVSDNFNMTTDYVLHTYFENCIVAHVCGVYNDEFENTKYVVRLHNTTVQYVVDIDEEGDADPSDIEEGVRVGLTLNDHSILEVYPPPVDAFAKVVEVTAKPTVTFRDIGGYSEQIKALKEVFVMKRAQIRACKRLRIVPPKGVLLYGLPGTGKTLCAKAVANATGATFLKVVSTELVKKNIGEGARLVREIFKYARTKKSAVIFFDEVMLFSIKLF
jgi:26S proteasome regulatory subunit T1